MAALSIGDRMPEFPELPGADFKAYRSGSFDGIPLLVVAFTCNHCPHAAALEGRMKSLAQWGRNHGLCLVAINPNDEEQSPEDDYEQMVLRSRMHEYGFPYLRDADQETATAFGASHTPEFFLFDASRRLRFHGSFDDNWQDPDRVGQHYLNDAIGAIQAGSQVTVTETPLEGCAIKWCNSPGVA